MERCPVRIGLTAACLAMAAVASAGCNALGPKGKDAQADPSAFYDEFFGQDDPAVSPPSSVPADEAPRRLFKRNRLPGGLSPEAREIERGSFNIY